MSDGISVLLPYKDLQSLLVASEKLSGLEKKVARLSEQYFICNRASGVTHISVFRRKGD